MVDFKSTRQGVTVIHLRGKSGATVEKQCKDGSIVLFVPGEKSKGYRVKIGPLGGRKVLIKGEWR